MYIKRRLWLLSFLMLIFLSGCYEQTTGYVEFNGKKYLSDSSGKVACTIDVKEGEKFVLFCSVDYIKKELLSKRSNQSAWVFYLERSKNKIRVQPFIEYIDIKFEEESVFKFTLEENRTEPPTKIDFEISIKGLQ